MYGHHFISPLDRRFKEIIPTIHRQRKGGIARMSVDIKWFQDRIRDLGLSQRRVSAMIAHNPNTMSLILNGKRKVTHDEIPQIAQLLDTTPEEILFRLGAEAPAGQRSRALKCVGTTDETGRVVDATGPRTVPAINKSSANTRGILFDAAASNDWRHGWVFYYDQPAKPRAPDADTVNSLCVVEVGDKKGSFIGVIRRGVDRGRYDVVNPFTGQAVVKAVQIRTANPVTWIKTS